MITLTESFNSLPDTSRLWLLALDAPPTPEVLPRLMEGLEGILGHWRHKGHAYQGAGTLLHGQILAVTEPDLAANPSGCAIDSMLRKVDRLVSDLGLHTVDSATAVLVRSAEGLRAIPKADLEPLILSGELDAGTAVLDLSLYSLGDLRSGNLERPLALTWIGRKFQVA